MAAMMQTNLTKATSGSRRSAVAPSPAMGPAAASICRSTKPQVQAVQPAVLAPAIAPLRSGVVTRAAAAEPATQATKPAVKEWYALVASADFFFNDPQNESLAEQLRERVRFYKEQNREIDFFFVPEPKWLEARYPAEAKKVKRPSVALVSADKNWIVFMKLRLDRVLRFDLGAIPDSEVLAVGGEIPHYPVPTPWTAPYPPYTPGWWEVFYPKKA